MIRRTTADGVRVTIEAGVVCLGFEALNRKPLTPADVALLAEVVGLCDADEMPLAVRLSRNAATPGAILNTIEARKNPAPAKPIRYRRGDIIGHRLDSRGRVLLVEY